MARSDIFPVPYLRNSFQPIIVRQTFELLHQALNRYGFIKVYVGTMRQDMPQQSALFLQVMQFGGLVPLVQHVSHNIALGYTFVVVGDLATFNVVEPGGYPGELRFAPASS